MKSYNILDHYKFKIVIYNMFIFSRILRAIIIRLTNLLFKMYNQKDTLQSCFITLHILKALIDLSSS